MTAFARFGDFSGHGEQRSFHEPTNDGMKLFKVAWKIPRADWARRCSAGWFERIPALARLHPTIAVQKRTEDSLRSFLARRTPESLRLRRLEARRHPPCRLQIPLKRISFRPRDLISKLPFHQMRSWIRATLIFIHRNDDLRVTRVILIVWGRPLSTKSPSSLVTISPSEKKSYGSRLRRNT